MIVTYLQELGYALYLYLRQYPLMLLLTIGVTAYVGAAVGRRVIRSLDFFDRVKKEFSRVGVRPTPQQAQALRDDYAAIAAENARQGLRARLQQQDLLNQEKAQLAYVAQLSQAHVALVKEIGATLQAIEVEYQKCDQSLTSAQAKEALRLAVERAVVQITALATDSASTLPPFAGHAHQQGESCSGRFPSTHREFGTAP